MNRIGPYLLLGELGRGGMATVYRATDSRTSTPCAVKVLSRGDSMDDMELARFAREAEIASSLDHPNIVRLFEWGSEPGGLYLAMEIVEGVTLLDWVMAQGPLTPGQTLSVALAIASALQLAHERYQVIHRDVKPENVLVAKDGRLKLTDFGLAKSVYSANLSTTGSFIGSIFYVSPEHLQGGRVDERSDVYSLGVTLYRVATGFLPFWHENQIALLYQILHQPPVLAGRRRPDLPSGLAEAIDRAMRRQPADRFPTMRAFLEALHACAIAPQPLVSAENTSGRGGLAGLIHGFGRLRGRMA